MKAGTEMDIAVAVAFMGYKWEGKPRGKQRLIAPNGDCVANRHGKSLNLIGYPGPLLPGYSIEIAAAWTVHQRACEQLFSKRKQYLQALQDQTGVPMIAWPDVLVVLKDIMPHAICAAVLKVCDGR